MKNENHRPDLLRIACFISPHGFGHAARAAATIEAVGTRLAPCHFEIFTTVPSWFFADSLSVPFSWHPVTTDIGLVQENAFTEDIEKTLENLNTFLPFNPALVADLAEQIFRKQCRLILCDIAPLGIAVGRKSGVPSVLVENFTWDRIYAGYPSVAGMMAHHITYLRRIFDKADHHIQTEPVCFRDPADLTVGPVSRGFRTIAPEIRQQLGIPDAKKVVLITTGGIPERHGFLDQLKKFADVNLHSSGQQPFAPIARQSCFAAPSLRFFSSRPGQCQRRGRRQGRVQHDCRGLRRRRAVRACSTMPLSGISRTGRFHLQTDGGHRPFGSRFRQRPLAGDPAQTS